MMRKIPEVIGEIEVWRRNEGDATGIGDRIIGIEGLVKGDPAQGIIVIDVREFDNKIDNVLIKISAAELLAAIGMCLARAEQA